MITNFCEALATDLQEVEVPIFIENLSYWIRKNAANQKNFLEDRYWSYNSYPAFAKLYPFWSEQKIRRIIKRAVKEGLLIIGNFNKKKYDNTNWYTLTDKALAYYPALHGLILNTPVEIDRPPVEIDRPIPKELNSLSNIINITTSDNSKISCEQVRDVYHEVLPDSPRIRVIGNELKKQIKSMIRNWPQYNKDKKPFTLKSFADFLSFIHRNYGWFLKPYKNPDGKKKHNNLTNITREKNIVRIINGEFSAS